MFQEGAELLVTSRSRRRRASAGSPGRGLNGRGNGALRKIGAVQEGVLRKSFLKNGEYLDQALWTILDEEWKANTIWGGTEGMIVH